MNLTNIIRVIREERKRVGETGKASKRRDINDRARLARQR